MCGLTGIISIRQTNPADTPPLDHILALNEMLDTVGQIPGDGKDRLEPFWNIARSLKQDSSFFQIYSDSLLQEKLSDLSKRLAGIIKAETDSMSLKTERLKDIAWCLNAELSENIEKIRTLMSHTEPCFNTLIIFKKINSVLNSIDRLEVRGRDSAGISLMFVLDASEFDKFKALLGQKNLAEEWAERTGKEILLNKSISVNNTSVSFAYKTAAEIGSLGDNVSFLRKQIQNDMILKTIAGFPHLHHTVISHTRWASVGAITEPNCHPVDNRTVGNNTPSSIIHVCLNGDIDNYLELKNGCEAENRNLIPKDITTDTKIIPLQIEKYIRQGMDVTEAFRASVRDFNGSHAICMHTDLAPGKLFLAQKGSGQAIFIGLAQDHYMPASEVYGFIEETSSYIKVDGEKTVEGKNGEKIQGQIFVLDQNSRGGLDGIKAMFYDGTPVELGDKDIKSSVITSRDIDRQGFPHYFLKEISESPMSVEKTLLNRWEKTGDNRYAVVLDEKVFPKKIKDAILSNQIRRIFFVGQGTAGVAAQACADILTYYMNDPSFAIRSMKASEMSGFKLYDYGTMEDSLLVAITQSGTTADTNRTVDMVRERGAHTLAIVNRRDSNITFKVEGVMYTSSGRDIEMSVASTKAFYSQIVAGALLGLHIACLKGCRDEEFVSEEIGRLLELPGQMRKILSLKKIIEASAKRTAVTRTYWAAVGSGPNKTSADEIRIKLSELCYKTISSDYVEDKKHIDLSSEPLIIVCAGGTRERVIGDIVKDTAIFKAHKAVPIVIADEGEDRFDSYAEDVFHVPAVKEHLAPIMNTLVGHIWGYYAALAINEGSRFLFKFREEIQKEIDCYVQKGLDVYELVLEKAFREKIARFYNEFRKKRSGDLLLRTLGLDSDLTLLLKYLSGRLPVSDFELDFGIRGTALNMLNMLFECLGKSINNMSRPVDAIKHQAKTVTVGTSRISEKTEGILFDTLTAQGFKASQLTAANVIVLKNLQGVVSGIPGITLYRISGLNLLGEPADETVIEMVRREGTSAAISSRVEKDKILKGSKKIIVREGNVYIGKGRRDDRSILVIPIISDSSAAPNMIEHLLLLNVEFKENIPLSVKIKALGGKYERIKNIVHENSISWEDRHLEQVETRELFGLSAEKIGDFIVSALK